MKILIVGHKGQLGADLMQRASQYGVDTKGADLPECDITQADSIRQMMADAGSQTGAVINAAAYTAVDRAESEEQMAYAVNRDGAGLLARACKQNNIPLIHISTDYVFGGLKTAPYIPTDPVNPMGVYGQSKAAGETTVQEQCEHHVIVRTSWLYGLHGENFVKTMLRLGKEREELQVVDDQIGSPTYAGDLATALIEVAVQITKGKSPWGTYHFCNAGALTWYAFARKIFSLARSYENFAVRDIVSILTAHYPTPAPRPHFSVLDCTSFEKTFNVVRRPWDTALKEMLAALYA